MTELLYNSTRGDGESVSSSVAILKGIAADGGLYVPERIPAYPLPSVKISYRQLAYEIMKLYLSDYTEAELHHCVDNAYDQKFDTPDIAPLTARDGLTFLELYHGPTLAFKDMALSILPHLLTTAAKKQGLQKDVVILTATSGDTGKAALEGFAGVKGTKIIVFFPEHGVSKVQKKQMVTQAGDNTHVIGIEGNFDDAQSGVKEMFTDPALLDALDRKGFVFSSANSINIGRLIPQIVYYYYAYLQLVAGGGAKPGQPVNFAVPTGNFGNILAGYYAKQMGLPIHKLICASNENKVLFDFFETGVYDKKREFVVTMSPSMDILISSNLERLLYHAAGENAAVVAGMMRELSERGKYSVSAEMRAAVADFAGGFASEHETAETIRDIFAASRYLIDTHTAVAAAVARRYRSHTGDARPMIVVSTASPYKFAKDVMTAIDPKFASHDDFSLFAEMGKLTQSDIPSAVKNLERQHVMHKTVCEKHEMQSVVKNILGLT